MGGPGLLPTPGKHLFAKDRQKKFLKKTKKVIDILKRP